MQPGTTGDASSSSTHQATRHTPTRLARHAPAQISNAEIERLYWQHRTSTFLYQQDLISWVACFFFMFFVLHTMGFDPMYLGCGVQLAVQLVWMLRYPTSYKHHRDRICLAVRLWRTFVIVHMSSGFKTHILSIRPVLRSLLLASGSLINFVMAVGYQLKFSMHIQLQAFQVAVSVLAGTKNVADFVNQDNNLPAVSQVYDIISAMSSSLLEGMSFAGHHNLSCRPNVGMVVVLFAQLFLGFLLPTYLLFVWERGARSKFKSRLLAGHRRRQMGSTALDTFLVAGFGAVGHVLLLALMGSVVWEALCCGSCWYQGGDAGWWWALSPAALLGTPVADRLAWWGR